jgi:hypothetical protein
MVKNKTKIKNTKKKDNSKDSDKQTEKKEIILIKKETEESKLEKELESKPSELIPTSSPEDLQVSTEDEPIIIEQPIKRQYREISQNNTPQENLSIRQNYERTPYLENIPKRNYTMQERIEFMSNRLTNNVPSQQTSNLDVRKKITQSNEIMEDFQKQYYSLEQPKQEKKKRYAWE